MPQLDKSILLGLRNGKLKHFEMVFRHYNRWIYNFVFDLLKDAAAAQDITQDVFIQVWNHRENIDSDANFEGYLFTIARNMVYHAVQQEVKRQLYAQQVQYQGHGQDVEYNEADKLLMEEYIMNLSKQLPDMRRQILMLYWKSGLNYREIAECLNISESTVATQIQRSLKFIRSKID
uniref:RNA polymerase sigma-70 factor n=1 Tax=Prevotella sp. GTC17260 TaxID=3236796 RepID=A0AB33JDL4_9BACT